MKKNHHIFIGLMIPLTGIHSNKASSLNLKRPSRFIMKFFSDTKNAVVSTPPRIKLKEEISENMSPQ